MSIVGRLTGLASFMACATAFALLLFVLAGTGPARAGDCDEPLSSGGTWNMVITRSNAILFLEFTVDANGNVTGIFYNNLIGDHPDGLISGTLTRSEVGDTCFIGGILTTTSFDSSPPQNHAVDMAAADIDRIGSTLQQPNLGAIFTDGFESGDVSAWSSANNS